jgi:DNA-binding protein H-NS
VQSYEELKAQADKVLADLEKARQNEIRQAVAQIKATMSKWDLTLEDLRQAGVADIRAKAPSRLSTTSTSRPKYRGPNGELWGGGRGRRPDWVLHILKNGGDLEQYRIQSH